MNEEAARTMEGGFTPKGSVQRSSLPFMMRPRNDSNFTVFASDKDGFEAYVLHTVLNKIDAELVRASPVETIGLLAGRVLRDSGGPYTLVLASQDARGDETEATPGHVRISATGHANLRRRLEMTAYGLDLVGWYHSHPRFPARFSSVDTTEQSTLTDPNHLGIVVSGIDDLKPYGVYRGPAAIQLVSQTSIRRPITHYASKSIAISSDQMAASSSVLPQKVSSDSISTVGEHKHAASPSTFSPNEAQSQRSFSLRDWLLLASALGAIAIFIWLGYRMHSIEKRLSALGDLRTTSAIDNRPRFSDSSTEDSRKPAEIGSPSSNTPKSTEPSDLPANPKLPVSKGPGRANVKKPRGRAEGRAKPKSTMRSANSAGVVPEKTGATRRSAPVPNRTPKTGPTPLPRPSPRNP